MALLLLCLSLPLPCGVQAVRSFSRGNKPVRDPGWPEGALAVANLPSRVGWWEFGSDALGGGEFQFLYQGDGAALVEAFKEFVAIRAPALDVVIHDGVQTNACLIDPAEPNADTHVDWAFTIWVPAAWHRLFNNPNLMLPNEQRGQPVDPPRLDVSVDGALPVSWPEIPVPGNLHLRDERTAAVGLSPAKGSVVRVQVFDMATGKVVRQARVSLSEKRQERWTTVAEGASGEVGQAQVTKIPPGAHRVCVEADGYTPRLLDEDVYGAHTFKRFTAELAKAATFTGLVIDSEGKPLVDVELQPLVVLALNGRPYKTPKTVKATTDQSGRFELSGLPTGYVQLWTSTPGFRFVDHSRYYEVPRTDAIVRLSRAGAIRVSVTDIDGRALSRFEDRPLIVEIKPKDGSGTWGGSVAVREDGTVDFSNVPPGEYQVSSHPNPFREDREYSTKQVVTVAPGGSATVTVVYH